MPDSSRPVNVALLAVPEVTASALYGMLDLFASAGRDFPFIIGGVFGEQSMRPYVVARGNEGFSAANGVWVKPDFSLEDCPAPDIVCLPDFFIHPGASVAGAFDPEAAWIRRVHGQGALLASACTGAVLLGEAGLLRDGDATIHWGYVDTLARHYPGVRVQAAQSLVLGGEAQRIVMAGGGSSWQDLALYLIARHVGIEQAMEVARVYMLQWHDLGQQPFASLLRRRQTSDALVARCQAWAETHFRSSAPVAAMVALSGLAQRSLVRRFTKATGLAPLGYIHALRLEEAKHLLETSDQAFEAIANDVGYEDTSFFGRLFRRKIGLTPAQYRVRFGALRRVLQQP